MTPLRRLHDICQQEGVMAEEQAIDELVSITEGDLRKSITILQSLACAGDVVGVEEVHEMSGLVPHSHVTKLVKTARSGQLDDLVRAVKDVGKHGFSAYQLIKQLSEVLLRDPSPKATHKAAIFEKLAVSAVVIIIIEVACFNAPISDVREATARRRRRVPPTARPDGARAQVQLRQLSGHSLLLPLTRVKIACRK